MVDLPGHALFGRRSDERKIPLAERGERAQGRTRSQTAIHASPFFLIEGLNDVVPLRKRLTEAKAERNLAVRQVTEDLARVPFPRCRPPLHVRGGQAFADLRELSRRLFQHVGWVLAAEKRRVRIRRERSHGPDDYTQRRFADVKRRRRRPCTR